MCPQISLLESRSSEHRLTWQSALETTSRCWWGREFSVGIFCTTATVSTTKFWIRQRLIARETSKNSGISRIVSERIGTIRNTLLTAFLQIICLFTNIYKAFEQNFEAWIPFMRLFCIWLISNCKLLTITWWEGEVTLESQPNDYQSILCVGFWKYAKNKMYFQRIFHHFVK